MRGPRPVRAGLLLLAAFAVAGCGIAASGSPASIPATSIGPPTTVTAATAQTRGEIVAALSLIAVQLGDATRPYRPPESGRLRDAPRAVYQVVLPNEPDAGYVVVYEWLLLSYHLPADSFIGSLALIRFLRTTHAIHHDPRLMQRFNFNVTLPLWDLVRGTWVRDRQAALEARAASAKGPTGASTP